MKRAIPWIVAAVAVVVLAGGFALFGDGVLEWYYASQASKALKEGRPERAVEMFEKQLSISPGDDSLRLRLAALLAEQGLYSRAERNLTLGIQQVSDPLPLYLKLSEVYVRQDKLYDAQELLSGIANQSQAEAVRAERPAAPVLDPPPGTYDRLVSVSVAVPEGWSCYISWEGEIPSVEKDAYAAPRKLEPGVTHFRAILVDDRGVVSEWTSGEYRLENVVYELAFADASVEALVRAALERPEGPILSNEVGEIAELTGDEPAAYATLDDLKLLPGLKKVSLTGTGDGCDLGALPFLAGVEQLKLEGFSIGSVELEFVGQMTWLNNLALGSNMISDISQLSGLVNLETLDVGANSVLDISPLSAMPNLRELRAPQNAVQDLTPLSALTGLEVLLLADNRVKTLDGLSALSALRVLDISRNYVENTAAVAGLASLTELYASGNAIEKLNDFSSLSKLTVLTLSSNAIVSVDPLSGLKALERLDVLGNAVTALTGLEGCSALKYLEASKNQIASVEPLRAHPALAELRVESNKLTTLLPLKDCPKLKEIYAFGNSLTDNPAAFAGTGITVFRN